MAKSHQGHTPRNKKRDSVPIAPAGFLFLLKFFSLPALSLCRADSSGRVFFAERISPPHVATPPQRLRLNK
jgi:hypothetical protein